MPHAATRPEKIVDKNGVLTTRHKKVAPSSASTGRVNGITKDNNRVYFTGDPYFTSAKIRQENGTTYATGDLSVGTLELGVNEDEFWANSDVIRDFIKNEYGTEDVVQSGLGFKVGFSSEVKDASDPDLVLDALYSTRVESFHADTESGRLANSVFDLISNSDDSSFEPTPVRYAFDDEL